VTALDHVTVTASDFALSLAFYDAALGALGLVRTDELVDEEGDEPDIEAAAWGRPDDVGRLWLVAGPFRTTGLHVRFRVDSRVQVETFYETAVQRGGAPHAAPRRWTLYRRGEFNAIVADPDGNLIEAVAPE
jgi:catechol 2,3-dioxygenase-like lactoylglutathione lyase family enzyme